MCVNLFYFLYLHIFSIHLFEYADAVADLSPNTHMKYYLRLNGIVLSAEPLFKLAVKWS